MDEFAMTPIMKRMKKESAVSPVIGVMLMLVVTIIVAAVVAAFAGGLVTTAEKAPTAVLDVKISSAADIGGSMMPIYAKGSKAFAPDFTIDHISGDALDTKDLSITFKWGNKTKSYVSTFDGSADEARDYTSYNSYSYKTPLFINNGDTGIAWGNASISAGSHVQTGANSMYVAWTPDTLSEHVGSVFMDDLMGRDITDSFTPIVIPEGSTSGTTHKGIMEILPKGTVVEVIIKHDPTQSIIYDKEVIVQ